MAQLWLIGGTQESGQLARAIAARGLPCIVTVTTETAIALYPVASSLTVQVTRFTPESLAEFLTTQAIAGILDASHPFAVEISQQAIAAAQPFQIPYLRFERPALPTSPDCPMETVPTVADLLRGDRLAGERVLLILGYRSLALFQPWQARATLFARILPSTTALTAAIAAGFTPDRLIALRPPLSLALEQALWQHWHISLVVTKASGDAGGEAIKRQVAAALGIPLVTIARPAMTYPQQTSDLEVAVAFGDRCLDAPAPAIHPD